MPEDRHTSAREFYGDRLRESFNQTRLFESATHRLAEEVINTSGFDAIVAEYAPGTLDAARRIGEMSVVYLDAAPGQPGPWWRDLCSYERAHFLQVATTESGPPTNRPRRGVSALCANFKWNMPEVLTRLKTGQPITDDLRRDITLLFSRGAGGNIYVVEVGSVVERVFRQTNGMRNLDQIASTAAVSPAQTTEVLNSLAGIGAVVLAMTSEQMMEALKQQGKA